MSSSQQNDAGEKFWQTAELIEHLLPFLEFESTLKLAQSHALTLNILKIDSNWNKLIRRLRARKSAEKWEYFTRFKVEIEEPLLSALSSILSRDPFSLSSLESGTYFTFSSVKIQTLKSARAFNTLIHNHLHFTLGIEVCGDIGAEGWEVLAQAVQVRTDHACWQISTSKSLLNKAAKESLKGLRSFWVALGWGSRWDVSSCGLTHGIYITGNIHKDNAWRRLLEFSDMSNEEWVASFDESDDSEGEEEEEEEENEVWGPDGIIDSSFEDLYE